MKTLPLEELQKEINQFSSERDWDQFHSVKNLAMALSVEASELTEIFQWMKEEDSNQISKNPELLGKVEEEVADVFVYLLRIVSKTHIDLETAVRKKLVKNAEKYPVDKARGNSRKYDQL